jgi:hypothetical protein
VRVTKQNEQNVSVGAMEPTKATQNEPWKPHFVHVVKGDLPSRKVTHPVTVSVPTVIVKEEVENGEHGASKRALYKIDLLMGSHECVLRCWNCSSSFFAMSLRQRTECAEGAQSIW